MIKVYVCVCVCRGWAHAARCISFKGSVGTVQTESRWIMGKQLVRSEWRPPDSKLKVNILSLTFCPATKWKSGVSAKSESHVSRRPRAAPWAADGEPWVRHGGNKRPGATGHSCSNHNWNEKYGCFSCSRWIAKDSSAAAASTENSMWQFPRKCKLRHLTLTDFSSRLAKCSNPVQLQPVLPRATSSLERLWNVVQIELFQPQIKSKSAWCTSRQISFSPGHLTGMWLLESTMTRWWVWTRWWRPLAPALHQGERNELKILE